MVSTHTSIKPEMNVTPLVDVVLVLLIIFMVIAPQMEAGATVKLPSIVHPDKKTETKTSPITVSITRDGALYLEKDKLDRVGLSTKLRALREENALRKILLKADREVAYGDVRTLFKECQEMGFPGIALQVEDRKNRSESQANHGI